jgi:hypothetical protein
MKITGVETRPFRIPMKIVTKWATGSQEAAEHVLVQTGVMEEDRSEKPQNDAPPNIGGRDLRHKTE